MANPLTHHTFQHVVHLDKLELTMEKLFDKIKKISDDFLSRPLLPSIVYVKPPNNLPGSDAFTFRKFLNGLRKVQQKHFVRFATNLLWIMESDTSDMFYARGNPTAGHVDVELNVRILGLNHVELKVMIPFTNRQHLILREMTKIFWGSIEAPDLDLYPDDDLVWEAVARFHQEKYISSIAEALTDNLHILFIPNLERQSYTPVPIWGMSHADARRRFKAAEKTLTFLHESKVDLVPDIFTEDELLILLIQSVQHNEADEDRAYTAKRTYELAELILGYYIVKCDHNNRDFGNHELMVMYGEQCDDDLSLEVFSFFTRNISS